MPVTRMQRRVSFVQTHLPWRVLLGKRVVRRHVQGVDLFLPWAHPLPDFAGSRPWYGQNLIALAKALHVADDGAEPMAVLDVGANIGDSAAQIIAATGAQVLCVEGDRYWVDFLRRNLEADARATIEEVLLVPDGTASGTASPVRHGGTTRFAEGGVGEDAMPTMTVGALRDAHPEFARLRLVKSDTDGYDPALVPAVAEAWADASPVLFFEFDPILAKAAGNRDPNALWGALEDLGYEHLALWDNTGDPLGRLSIAEAPKAAASLEPRPVHLGYDFWDVAACRADDGAAVAALETLVPEPYAVEGTWRLR